MSYNTMPEQVNENQLNLNIIADAVNNLINIVGQLESLIGSDILNKVNTNTSDIASLQGTLASLTEQLNTGLSSLQGDLASLQTETSDSISTVNNRISNLKEVYSEFALDDSITSSTGSGTNSRTKTWTIELASVLNIYNTYLTKGEVIELQFIFNDNIRRQIFSVPFLPSRPSNITTFTGRLRGSNSVYYDCTYRILHTISNGAVTKVQVEMDVPEFVDAGNFWPSQYPSLIAVIRTIDSE